jgi:ADP-heptose:LPS heptosyltransferase
VGYNVGLRRFAYNVVKPRDEFRDGKKVAKYAAEVNLDVVRYLGVEAQSSGLVFGVDAKSREAVDRFLASRGLEPGGFVCVSPAGSWPAKTWELEKFAALADLVAARTGLRVAILWGPGERGLAESIRPREDAGRWLARPASARPALAGELALLVSNDPAQAHSGAVGTQTVTVFGPTNLKTWNPVSLKTEPSADVDACAATRTRAAPRTA